jgi:hypothetical protein
MKVRHALFALAALAATPAAAQLVPGTRAPASPAEAIDDAHMIVCTLAAAGRPMGGLNIPMVGGEGYAPVDKVPDPLARFVQSAPEQKILEYPGAGGPLWIVFDQASSRCSIYAFTDPAPVEARLLETFNRGKIWKPKKVAGPGIDRVFEWKAEPGLRLRTEISLPHAAGEPIVVAVEPARR